MTKSEIVEHLGDSVVLLPRLIADALAANDRLKLRLSLLQEAAVQAREPHRTPRSFAAELRACGMGGGHLDHFAATVRPISDSRFIAPGAQSVMDGLGPDLEAMLAPLKAVQDGHWEALNTRMRQLADSLPPADNDELDISDIARMSAARRDGPDSVHLLVMDLHKAINRLASDTAVEDIDGAKVHHLEDWDRRRVAAFMRGVNRTAPLAFGHPGLGTTAARAGGRLTLQNDIGETDAHVLVIHVDGRLLTMTYTDVHRRRAKFFMGLFDGRLEWSPLSERSASGMPENEQFYLVTGRFDAGDDQALDDLLAFLGSRLVFLIDWNKARKALQTFVDRGTAIDLLSWAATHDFGHRAFLVLGGTEFVLEAVRRAAEGHMPYGVRLDQALGMAETVAFLRQALCETSVGLRAGSSARLIRDGIQADLARKFETAECAVLTILVRHLGLSRTLASAIADALTVRAHDDGGSANPLVAQARRLEAKADRLTVQARETCARLHNASSLRRLIDEVENAMDALDECAFLVSLRDPDFGEPAALGRLADIVIDGIGELVRATDIAARLPDRQQADAAAILAAIDATSQAERDADAAERDSIGAFMQENTGDARRLVLGLEVSRALEGASDHVAHAALALRERLFEELSA